MSGDIKVGRFNLSNFSRLVLTIWFPVAFNIIAIIIFRPYGLLWDGFGWFAVAFAAMIVLNYVWVVIADWQTMYRAALDFADHIAKLTEPDYETNYSVLVWSRQQPPRLFWVVVVVDHCFRVYMGWNFWGMKEPEFDKAISRGVRRRQVA